MEKKKYNLILGIMIFLFIIVVGVSIAWGLGYIGVKSNENELSDQSNLNETNNEVVENNKNIQSNENKVQADSSKEEKNTVISNVNLFDLGKCLNDNDNEYNVTAQSLNGYYLNYGDGKIKISITKDSYMNDYEVKGIDASKVAEAFLLGAGQDIVYPTAYFLMKDGTVEWFNVKDAVEKNDFNAEGKISNVANVVRIVNAGVGPKSGEGSGWIDVIAVRADGTFYNIGQ